MRAKEFIQEQKANKKGKITRRQGMSTVGVGTFRDPNFADRTYVLNRVMMAAACSDGINDLSQNENSPNAESWVGKENTYFPYSELENNMLKQAFQAIGAKYTDLAKGDLRSQELADTNKKSPMVKFKGYK